MVGGKVGCLVGCRVAGFLVSCMVGSCLMVGWLVACLVGLAGCLIGLTGWLNGWLVNCLHAMAVWMVGSSVGRLEDGVWFGCLLCLCVVSLIS